MGTPQSPQLFFFFPDPHDCVSRPNAVSQASVIRKTHFLRKHQANYAELWKGAYPPYFPDNIFSFLALLDCVSRANAVAQASVVRPSVVRPSVRP